MHILPDGVSFDLRPWSLLRLFLFFAAAKISIWVIEKRKISKREAERLLIHLECIGTLIVGFSIMGNQGLLLGNFPTMVQLFNPLPGILFILIAYFLKLALNRNWLLDESPSLLLNIKASWTNLRKSLLHKKKIESKDGVIETVTSKEEALNDEKP